MTDNPDDMIVLAQAQTQTPPALVAPAPNWVSPYPKAVEGMVREIQKFQKYPGAKPESLISYSENGSLGIPALTWKTFDLEMHWQAVSDVDLSKTRPVAEILNLASHSCTLLDLIVGQVGAWGPECKIVRFLEMPEGQMSKSTWTGPSLSNDDCLYTPVRVGMDRVRFILDNGARRQVDVTVLIDVMEQSTDGEPMEDSGEEALLFDGLNLSFSDLPGAAVAQTIGTQITLDTNATGYGWFIDYTPYLNEELL
jgi:hypothetical protein